MWIKNLVLLPITISTFSAIADTESSVQFISRSLPHHVYEGGWEHYVGGGIAAFDCNQDNFAELYLAGGSNPAQLFINQIEHAGDKLKFSANTPNILAIESVLGAYPIDIDSDGNIDLAVLTTGSDILLQGLGDCQFSPFKHLSFHSEKHWTTAFSATWENKQSLPTLAFGTYVDRHNPEGPFGACDNTLLYRPQNINYPPPNALKPSFCALSMLFSDWQRTGQADLRISNDRHYYIKGGQEQLWKMAATPSLYSAQDGWQDYQLWGMGIASRDLNNDGFADVYLTSMGDQRLQYFNPHAHGPHFIDAPYTQGTSAHRPYTGGDGRPSTGWHTSIGDVNNDGLDDIFVTKGNVEQMPDAALSDPNNLLLQQANGTFLEYGEQAGVASLERGRGGAMIDLNQDGKLDIVVVNRRAQAELFENMSSSGRWLQIALRQPPPNVYAIGAHVEIQADKQQWVQELTIGGGHASGQLDVLHFGLGKHKKVAIRIIWPDQSTSSWQTVTTNQRLLIDKPH